MARGPGGVLAMAWLLASAPALAQPDPFQGVAPPPASRSVTAPPRGQPQSQTPPQPRPQPRPPRQAAPAAPPATALPDLPLTGPVHRGQFRAGASVLPLPPGEWVAIQSASGMAPGPPVFGGGGGGRGGTGGGAQMQTTAETVLVRQEAGRITGVVVVQASTSDAQLAEWHAHPVCSNAEGADHRVVAASAGQQDCARTALLGPGQGIGSPQARGTVAGLAQRRAGFLPASMPAAQYRFASTLRALAVEYRFATEPGRIPAWMAAQQAALRGGFNGRAGTLPEP